MCGVGPVRRHNVCSSGTRSVVDLRALPDGAVLLEAKKDRHCKTTTITPSGDSNMCVAVALPHSQQQQRADVSGR